MLRKKIFTPSLIRIQSLLVLTQLVKCLLGTNDAWALVVAKDLELSDFKPASPVGGLTGLGESLKKAFNESFVGDGFYLMTRSPSFFVDLSADCSSFLYSLMDNLPSKQFFDNNNIFVQFAFYCSELDYLKRHVTSLNRFLDFFIDSF